MFGFKKKNSVQKDPVLYNFDKQPVLNTETGEFLMDFDVEQQKILRRLVDLMVPIGSFAYKGLPANLMAVIEEWIDTLIVVLANGSVAPTHHDSFRNRDIVSFKDPSHFNENIIYNIVHTDFDPEQMKYALIASEYGVDVCAEIEDVASFSALALALVSEGAKYGLNICDKIHQGTNIFELSDYVDKHRQKYLKKEQQKDKWDEFEWKLFH